MIKLVVTNEKNLELYELEKVHVGENKFGYYLIFLPEVLNGYNLSECEVKLVQVFEDNTSVAIDVDTTQEMRPIKEYITLDATSQAQTVTLSVLVTHNGNVIGKTNQKTFQVYPTKNATPIDPREELDEIIADLRADNAQLETTVSEQAAEIAEKTARITELNNQVENLTEETTEQAETIERQETTIDQLNSRVPAMETPPIVIPSGNTQLITPSENYDGLASVTVDRVTAAVDSDIQPENIREGINILGVEGTYAPLGGAGGIYVDEFSEQGYPKDITVKNWDGQNTEFNIPSIANKSIFLAHFEKLEFINCKNILLNVANKFGPCPYLNDLVLDGVTSLGDSTFRECSSLVELSIPSSLISIGGYAFSGCSSLVELTLPSSLTTIGDSTFSGCSSLVKLTLPSSLTTIGGYAFSGGSSLAELTLPSSLTSIGGYAFSGCRSLIDVYIENGFNCNKLNLSASTLYSHDTILSWFNALADRTGQTAYTLTIGTTNLNKMTAEEKAIATNKNWNLA